MVFFACPPPKNKNLGIPGSHSKTRRGPALGPSRVSMGFATDPPARSTPPLGPTWVSLALISLRHPSIRGFPCGHTRQPELHRATPRHTTLQHAAARYSTLQHATPHYTTLQHATARYITLHHAHHATPRYTTLHRATPRCAPYSAAKFPSSRRLHACQATSQPPWRPSAPMTAPSAKRAPSR